MLFALEHVKNASYAFSDWLLFLFIFYLKLIPLKAQENIIQHTEAKA
jgi:hypothetical protein